MIMNSFFTNIKVHEQYDIPICHFHLWVVLTFRYVIWYDISTSLFLGVVSSTERIRVQINSSFITMYRRHKIRVFDLSRLTPLHFFRYTSDPCVYGLSFDSLEQPFQCGFITLNYVLFTWFMSIIRYSHSWNFTSLLWFS